MVLKSFIPEPMAQSAILDGSPGQGDFQANSAHLFIPMESISEV
jgi:hypothetical protein